MAEEGEVLLEGVDKEHLDSGIEQADGEVLGVARVARAPEG